MRTLAAVDLGAQSGRVAVGRFDGSRLSIDIVHRFPNVPVRVRGTLYWDALRLYADVLDGLRIAARGGAVDSVAVDSWAVDFGLLDRSGRLIRNPVHYRDSRRGAAVEGVFAQVPPRELYDRTGIQLLPINTIFELAAMAFEPDPVLAVADRLLLIPDLIHYWLCGSTTTEFTNATTTQCFDVRARTWAVDLVERLGIPRRLLPEVVDPGTELGPVTDEESGIGGAAVVAGATHDTAAAVAGAPLTGERSAFLSVGTWSLVGVESSEPVHGDAAYRANLTNEGGVAGTFRVLRNVTGLWLLQECRRAWALRGSEPSLEELVRAARAAVPLQSLVDPNDPLFAQPGDMPARIAEYCERTGQRPPGDEGAIVRCIFESLALKHAECIDLLGEVTGRSLDELYVIGGGAKNELLCEWTACAAEKPVHAGPDEATLVGNLLVQAMALDEVSSLAEGRELVRDSFARRTYEPSTDAAWREARDRFAAISGARTEVEVGT
jgi:rhamnulokinase